MTRDARARRRAFTLAAVLAAWLLLCGFGPLEYLRSLWDTYSGNRHLRQAAREQKAGDAEAVKLEAGQAASAYDDALGHRPQDPRAGYNRGLAQAMGGDLDKAYQEFAQAAEWARRRGDRGAEWQAEYNAGTAGLLKNDREAAVKHLQRAAQLAPNDPRVLNNLRCIPPPPPPQSGQGKDKQDKKSGKSDQDKPKPQDPQAKPNKDEQEQPPPQGDEEPLTKEQAQQLLSSLAREDADMQKLIRRPPATKPRPTDKDW